MKDKDPENGHDMGPLFEKCQSLYLCDVILLPLCVEANAVCVSTSRLKAWETKTFTVRSTQAFHASDFTGE